MPVRPQQLLSPGRKWQAGAEVLAGPNPQLISAFLDSVRGAAGVLNNSSELAAYPGWSRCVSSSVDVDRRSPWSGQFARPWSLRCGGQSCELPSSTSKSAGQLTIRSALCRPSGSHALSAAAVRLELEATGPGRSIPISPTRTPPVSLLPGAFTAASPPPSCKENRTARSVRAAPTIATTSTQTAALGCAPRLRSSTLLHKIIGCTSTSSRSSSRSRTSIRMGSFSGPLRGISTCFGGSALAAAAPDPSEESGPVLLRRISMTSVAAGDAAAAAAFSPSEEKGKAAQASAATTATAVPLLKQERVSPHLFPALHAESEAAGLTERIPILPPAQRHQPPLPRDASKYLWRSAEELAAAGKLLRLQVGKSGVSRALLARAGHLLEQHQLIRMSLIQNCPLDVRFVAWLAENALDCACIKIKGHTATLYRQKGLPRPPASFPLDPLDPLPAVAASLCQANADAPSSSKQLDVKTAVAESAAPPAAAKQPEQPKVLVRELRGAEDVAAAGGGGGDDSGGGSYRTALATRFRKWSSFRGKNESRLRLGALRRRP